MNPNHPIVLPNEELLSLLAFGQPELPAACHAPPGRVSDEEAVLPIRTVVEGSSQAAASGNGTLDAARLAEIRRRIAVGSYDSDAVLGSLARTLLRRRLVAVG